MTAELQALLKNFVSVDWAHCDQVLAEQPGPHVYVVMLTTGAGSLPLYVGQTTRLLGRVGDYRQAPFSAPTDFRVGEAIKYLSDVKQCRISFLYKPSVACLKDEKTLIRELLLSGFTLLNFLGSFDYSTSYPVEEREVVHRFCDMLLARRIAN